MSHPRDLIDKIRALLAPDYDPTVFRYFFEQAIPGTRMFPDILIRDAGGDMVCAVEIGYTRPEKLTAYRTQHQIPDVRWYAKDGTLHTDVTAKVTVTRVSVEVTMQPPAEVSGYVVHHVVECRDPECYCDTCDRYASDCGCPDHLDDDETDERPLLAIAERPDPNDDDDDDDEAWERSHDYLRLDVMTVILTDRVRAWYVCCCDKCGATWFADPGVDDDPSLLELHGDLRDLTPQDFGRRYGAGRRCSWSEAVPLIDQRFHLRCEVADGHFLRHQDAAAVRAHLRAVITEKQERPARVGTARGANERRGEEGRADEYSHTRTT